MSSDRGYVPVASSRWFSRYTSLPDRVRLKRFSYSRQRAMAPSRMDSSLES